MGFQYRCMRRRRLYIFDQWGFRIHPSRVGGGAAGSRLSRQWHRIVKDHFDKGAVGSESFVRNAVIQKDTLH